MRFLSALFALLFVCWGAAYPQAEDADYWLGLAASREAADNLITPEGQSAFDAYSQALLLSEDKDKIKPYLESLKRRVIDRATIISERISYPAAIQYLEKAERVMTASPEISQAKSRLVERHEFLSSEQRYIEHRRAIRDSK